MRDWADFTIDTDAQGRVTLRLAGPLVVASVGELDAGLRKRDDALGRIDLSEVTEIDTAGAWLVWRLGRDSGAQVTGADDKAQRLIAAVGKADSVEEDEAEGLPFEQVVPAYVGGFMARIARALVGSIGFLGEVLIAFLHVLRHPSTFRIKALVRQIELTGVTALPIVGLMSFLVGIVIAQQGAVQLRQFGAEIYTVNLTGRLSFRELGVLMTAIMFAGRSGSAFAAQIGTMKLTEEVDAMRTIGVSPIEALVIPRVLASMLIMPLLGFYSALMAIIGGAFISTFALDIPFFTFLMRIQEVVPTHDMWVGLIKGPVFGMIVGMAGCYQGMQVQGNSEEVGLKTTIAVVEAIFLVIVLDAFFAVFFTEVGWG